MRLPRLRRLEPVLRRALRGPCRQAPGARVLVAVSGGADSTALLCALVSLAPEFDLRVSAAHLHHGLRGAAADADLARVRELCASLGVPLVSGRLGHVAGPRPSETRLRVRRRAFLRRAAARTGALAIATAHTADDQLETLLLRLARGTGFAGLGGMRPRRGGWIKPLLEATRDDVEHDLRTARIAWREDATNRDVSIPRNRVRHEVVPALLATFGRRGSGAGTRAVLARHAGRAAAEVRAAGAALAPAVRAALAKGTDAGAFALEIAGMRSLPLAVRREVVSGLWRRACPRGPALGLAQRDALALACAKPGPLRRWALPGGWWARRAGGRIEFHGPGATVPGPALAGRAKERSGGRPTGVARDGILPARQPRPRSRAAKDGSPVPRDARPAATPNSARRTASGHERTP